MNLIFMGTSEFAVPILQMLCASSSHKILQVYTTPPSAAGRGLTLRRTPVHDAAVKLDLPVNCPHSLKKDPQIVEEIKNIPADAIIVASYGRILPESLLHVHKHGCINVHPSALPRWRGAAPIERTILAGDKKTAVCIMQMDAGIDTGDIWLNIEVPVSPRITAPKLRDKLSYSGGLLLLTVLEVITQLKPRKQSEIGVTYAEKLKKNEGLIKWAQVSAEQVERMTRALNPWPGCFFDCEGEKIRILKAKVVPFQDNLHIPGLVIDYNITVCCGVGKKLIRPLILQRPGKRALSLEDFLHGFEISEGMIL